MLVNEVFFIKCDGVWPNLIQGPRMLGVLG